MNSMNKASAIIASLALFASVQVLAEGMSMGKQSDDMHMGGQSNDMGMGMRDRFDRMDKVMEKAHNTKDAKRHYELMEEHMDDMMEGMMMMRDDMGPGSGGRMGMSHSDSDDMDDMMGQRLNRFERRMDMMQEMMDQMVRHQREEMRMRGR